MTAPAPENQDSGGNLAAPCPEDESRTESGGVTNNFVMFLRGSYHFRVPPLGASGIPGLRCSLEALPGTRWPNEDS